MRDITVEDTPEWVLHLLACEGALVEGLTIRNNMEIPNSDGIDVDHCRGVEIRKCAIACGDDAISVKTTVQKKDYGPCTNVRVADCVLETQDSGVKIGTHCHQDIRNIVFERCEVKTSSRGIAIQMRDEGMSQTSISATSAWCPGTTRIHGGAGARRFADRPPANPGDEDGKPHGCGFATSSAGPRTAYA